MRARRQRQYQAREKRYSPKAAMGAAAKRILEIRHSTTASGVTSISPQSRKRYCHYWQGIGRAISSSLQAAGADPNRRIHKFSSAHLFIFGKFLQVPGIPGRPTLDFSLDGSQEQ